MVKRQLQRERFQVPEISTFDYLFENRNEANVGEIIDMGLAALEDSNRAKLNMVFRSVSFNSETTFGPTKQRNAILKNLLVDFSKLDLQPSHLDGNDVIGDSYEFLISLFAGEAGKKAGEFYTPAEVSTLLAKLVDPQPGNRISDPTCGSGSLLIKVAKEIPGKNYSLYGQENNGSTWALCNMNILQNRQHLRETVLAMDAQPEETDYTSQLDKEFLDKVMKVIEEELSDSEFSINDFCRMLGMSRTSVYNKIKTLTGQGPNDFIRIVRLNKAKELLVSRKYSIGEVANMVGFSDPKYFSTCFKKQFGTSPSKI
jgi:type I restriction-modification system DNA methylase subunit